MNYNGFGYAQNAFESLAQKFDSPYKRYDIPGRPTGSEKPVKIRWPRGRHNGRRITGFKITAGIDLAHCEWRPIISWRFWHWIHWLWFLLRFETTYHFND